MIMKLRLFQQSAFSPGSASPGMRGAIFYLGFFGAAGAYMPFMNVHFARLGLSGSQIGVLSMLFPLMLLLFAMPISALADRRRWRVPILQAALAGFALLFFLLGIPKTFAGLAPLLALVALFFSPIMAIGDSLVARMAARHSLNYGSMRLWGSVGFAASAIVCGALWQRFGFGFMFVAASLLFLPLVWYVRMLEEGPVVAPAVRRPVSDLRRDTGLVVLLVTAFLVGLGLAVAITFEGVYMDYLGGGQLLVGMLLGFSAFSELPTMRYSSAILQRLQGPRTLLLAYGLLAAAFIGYALAWAPWMLLILTVFKGLGFGLFFASTVRLLNERAPAEWSATAQAVMTAGMFGLAPLIGGPVAGLIYDKISPPAMFVSGAFAFLAAILVMLWALAKNWLAADLAVALLTEES